MAFNEVASLDDENVVRKSLTDMLSDILVYNNTTKVNDTVKSFLDVTGSIVLNLLARLLAKECGRYSFCGEHRT